VNGRVVVVGAGVAGLTTAYRLLRDTPELDLTLVESGERVGGRLLAVEVGDLELEAGPDAFVARKPWAVELCDELGLEMTSPSATAAMIWTDRGLRALPPTALGVPADLDGTARWQGLSRAGRFRALRDLVAKPHPSEADEALGALLRRRIGDEATDLLTAPLLAGLFAGDVDRLGVASTFPELANWERTYGSLIRGARAALRRATDAGPMFCKPTRGVTALTDALAERVGSRRIMLGTPVVRVRPGGNAPFAVETSSRTVPAEAVVLAIPSSATAATVGEAWPALARSLDAIRWVSTGVVLLVYPEATADALPDASGFVVPRERAPMTASTFLSRKWPNPRFGSRAVVRCFVGADGSEDVLDAADDEIVGAMSAHLAALLGLPARPTMSRVVRWPGAMPQYEVGHLERVAAIENALPAGIFVTGSAYRGVGVADTVRGANDVADRVRTHLLGATERTEHVR
jgi:protoporphyrinogen/coproporphyrinogen III oxidase